ncbi:helix-turn-helix domain-containing protein [uncultured Phascolarctobacterium sp.]|uniref:helix-turn-helix domain-containing protein n=1 Tax=uncultured Phascolarctobacterium sp. TaxID=512296 RepID=UPI0025E26760|nr:helix-turn-helix domain-containing protein [uncultured Phascolarctobacterium sp.]
MYDETKLSNVGFRIRFFRMEKSISQSELAQQIGISQTHLSNIECGRVQIGLKLLLRLANLLQHRLDEFFDVPAAAAPAPQGSYTAADFSTLLELLAQLKPALSGAGSLTGAEQRLTVSRRMKKEGMGNR